MTRFQKIALTGLRLTLGFMMFYAGIAKVFDPAWSPFGFLARAKTFPEFYTLFLDPSVISYTTFLNEWGLTLIGIALIVGLGVRIVSIAAIFMMVLYYFPSLTFPYAGEHAFIVDEHIIYAFGFLTLIAFNAGKTYALASILGRMPIFARVPLLKKLIA